MLFDPNPPPTAFESIDDESAELMLQLQLADLEELKERWLGKQKAGQNKDIDAAVSVFEEDVRDLQMLLADKRMTKSISEAVAADGNAIVSTMLEESIAREDHQMARNLGGRRAHRQTGSTVRGDTELDDDILAQLASIYVSEDIGTQFNNIVRVPASVDEEPNDQAEGSKWASKRSDSAGGANHRCVACRQDKKFFEVMAAPCRHEYCRSCLQELFEASLSDESLFPLRCCRQNIYPKPVEIFLTQDLKDRFVEKAIEYESQNRTYCHKTECSRFIRQQNIESEIATCPDCSARTCAVCKAEAHEGRDCPHDTALQQVLDLAQEEGWRRCFTCGGMVELATGCNHMTCICGTQFCYVCGRRWKECPCDQWDEARLLARADVVVQRDAPRLERNDPEGVVRMNEAARMLQERHECTHDNWRFVQGRHQCEECHYHLPEYIFECRRCRIRACNRCRRNRLSDGRLPSTLWSESVESE